MKVAVIGGGSSIEAAVSRVSSEKVAEAIQEFHDVKYIEFDSDLVQQVVEFQPDVVFPALHGTPGEDGTIQGFLDVLNVPYVGSGVAASARCIDKFVAKSIFRSAGLCVLDDMRIQRGDKEHAVERITQRFGQCVAIKPVSQGSALGVTPLPDGGDIQEAVDKAFECDDEILIEPFKAGHEITVGVFDEFGEKPSALPVIEILVADGEWYDYENKYKPGQSRHVLNPIWMEKQINDSLFDQAVDAHLALGCRDLSRADFIVEEDGTFWLLEVNTMPGMTPTSLFPEAARHIGIDMKELIERLLFSAIRRHEASHHN